MRDGHGREARTGVTVEDLGDVRGAVVHPHVALVLGGGDAVRVTIVELRRLHEASMRKIDRYDTSFWAALNHRGGEQGLGLLERQRVKVWLAKTYEDFGRLLGTTAKV